MNRGYLVSLGFRKRKPLPPKNACWSGLKAEDFALGRRRERHIAKRSDIRDVMSGKTTLQGFSKYSRGRNALTRLALTAGLRKKGLILACVCGIRTPFLRVTGSWHSEIVSLLPGRKKDGSRLSPFRLVDCLLGNSYVHARR